jgi:NADPH2:quinone reductase
MLDGSLKVTIGGRYTFDTVEKAHSALEDRRMIGKPLLIIAAH